MVKKSVKTKSRWQPLEEGASTMQVMLIPEVDEHSLHFDDMSTEEMLNLIKFIEQSNKTIQVENMVVERYLERMDPSALLKMKQALDVAAMAAAKAERAAQLGAGPSTMSFSKDALSFGTDSLSDSVQSGKSSSTLPRFGILGLGDKGPKLQVAQKIEVVNREIDELKNVLENFRTRARKFNYVLRCRNEEMSTRLQEVIDGQNHFEQKLLVEGLDPVTGKLHGEKFVRYLETRLKAEEMEIDKMRIKTGSLKSALKKVKQQLAQKEELGEILHAVDFEQLQIENRECQEILDENIAHVIRVKKINGKYGTLLNAHKKRLLEQTNTLEQLKQLSAVKEKLIKKLKEDEEKVNSEVNAASRGVEKITRLMKTYTVPDVMEYIKKKVELHDLKKQIKVRTRKIKLKDLVLSSQLQKSKSLTNGLSKTVVGSFSSTAVNRIFF